ncbi:MAG: hypothetical protein IKN49_02340 [Elusimicrobiaceae bacterium]|nr:hypothetical protein [Elusimicrobiaceae bacterium]
MQWGKLLLVCSLLIGQPLWAQTKLAICLEEGKREYLSRDYTHAQATFERCLRMDAHNVDTLLSLGGLSLTQDQLSTAKTYFTQALQNMQRSSPYFSYTYSMLGDISLKQQDNTSALRYYNQSLSYNRANVNSLVGKGVITENLGNKKEAASIYQTALAVEPLNLIARKRLIALEPIYFNDEEMLEAMKQRYAVLPDKEKLSDDDRVLFQKIHTAEQRGGINYLKEKYPNLPSDYIAVLFKDTSFAREVLTISGYNAMQKQIAQDAIVVFQKAGVPLKDVFDLRDLRGNKIFLEDSTLTESGLQVYQQALNGKRMFLMPNERVPATAADLKREAQQAQNLKDRGYTEISATEFGLIKQQTNCSEETLNKRLGLRTFDSKNGKRYFVYAKETTDTHRGVSWYYVASYRARKNKSIQVPENNLVETYRNWNYKICSAVDGELLE